MLHAESLGLVWAKYDSYNLHTLTLIYTFQNLNTAVNDKVWPDLDLGQTEEAVYAIERSYPKVGWAKYQSGMLNTSADTNIFQELEHGFKWQSMIWPWPRQKI